MKSASFDILHLDESGCGVAASDRGFVLISGALPGDRVRARFAHRSPHTGQVWFDAEHLVDHSALRRPFPCAKSAPFFGKCAGCPTIALPDDMERGLKRLRAEVLLSRWLDGRSLPMHRSPVREGYRTRAHFVAHGHARELQLGARIPRSPDVADVRGCAVLARPLAQVHLSLQRRLRRLERSAVSDGLRYVTLRAGVASDVLVEFITYPQTSSTTIAQWAALALDSHPSVIGVYHSTNESKSGTIHANKARLVDGKRHVHERIRDLRFAYATDTFAQLNPFVARAMYDKAAEWLAPFEPSYLWDLYCGVGSLGLVVSDALGCGLYGAEVNASSIELARHNADLNRVVAAFEVSNLSSIPTAQRPQAICVNPPRKGIAAQTREWLLQVHAPLVYMSCSAKTLARDLNSFSDAGWKVERIEAWNMMPNTQHYEVLALVLPPGRL